MSANVITINWRPNNKKSNCMALNVNYMALNNEFISTMSSSHTVSYEKPSH